MGKKYHASVGDQAFDVYNGIILAFLHELLKSKVRRGAFDHLLKSEWLVPTHIYFMPATFTLLSTYRKVLGQWLTWQLDFTLDPQ